MQERETAGSDIDVTLIGNVRFNDVIPLICPAQLALQRDIKLKRFLMGNEHDLAELVGHQP